MAKIKCKKKITNASQMSIIGKYPGRCFNKKTLKRLLEHGTIYEYRKGWFQKI